MSIRLSKVTKECNVGLQTVVEFLQKKGFGDVEATPNTKISEEQYEMLLKEFSPDKGLRSQAAKLSQQRQENKENKKESSRSKQQKKAEMIKVEVEKVEGPKILGHIDLNAPQKEKPAPKAEPAKETPKQEEVAVQEKPVTAEKETVQKPEAVETVQAAPKPKEEKPAVGSEVDGVFRLNPAPQAGPGITVKGHIDLSALNQSTRPKKKTKEEKRREREEKNRPNGQQGQGDRKKRTRIGKERVDVNAVASQIQNNSGNNSQKNRQGNNANNNANAAGNSGKNKQRHKNHPKQAPVQAEVSDEEVAKQVRETLARLTNKNNKMGKGAKYRREKREAIRAGIEEEIQAEAAESKILKLTEFVTANELATMMNIPVTQVIATCMSIGIMVSINQRMDAETINLVAEEFGFQTEYVSTEVSEAVNVAEDDEEDLLPRAPIVTVMGHVDHGKTSLLDYIRQTNVIAGEAGGITQHIGAYNVKLQDGRHVTFLDTPGHEAFTAMRARGAQVTDIAIIIIAADDSIMPQTKEAINHAMAANVPIVFAINKVDKPTANPEKIKEGLAQMNFLVEDWGGKYQSQDISAKKGIGVEELLEKVLLEAEMLDLKANPNRKAMGTIIESSLDKGRGYVATVLVSNESTVLHDRADIKDIKEARKIIAEGENLTCYTPTENEKWEEAYKRFKDIIK